jgi:hypothetical protein
MEPSWWRQRQSRSSPWRRPAATLDAGRRVRGHGHRLHRRRDRLGPAERLTKILSTREGDVRRTVRPVRVTSFGRKVTTDAVRVTVRCGRNAGRSSKVTLGVTAVWIMDLNTSRTIGGRP